MASSIFRVWTTWPSRSTPPTPTARAGISASGATATAPSSPFDGGAWAPAGSGFHLRQLTDGAWDSWAYEPDVYAFPSTAFAANPLAAPAPATADLDADGDVDLADLMMLQRNGFTPEGLDVWHSEFGQSASIVSATFAVPEPSAPTTVVLLLAVCLTLRRSC